MGYRVVSTTSPHLNQIENKDSQYGKCNKITESHAFFSFNVRLHSYQIKHLFASYSNRYFVLRYEHKIKEAELSFNS